MINPEFPQAEPESQEKDLDEIIGLGQAIRESTSLSEEEREEALELVDAARYSEAFTKYFREVILPKYGEVESRKAMLFHPLAGSSLTRGQWQNLPLDLPGGEYEKFIRGIEKNSEQVE